MTDALVWLWLRLWPGWDAVYPNLVASAISGSVVWLWGRRKFRQLHARHDELAAHVLRLHEHLGVTPDSPREEG